MTKSEISPGQDTTVANKKAIIMVTNHGQYEKKQRPTGLWLGELVHFYEIFVAQGYQCDIVSPKGGKTPLDPESLKGIATDKTTRDFMSDPDKMNLLDHTLAVSQVDWRDYAVIYYTGGHGTMWDFPGDTTLQILTQKIYEHGGVVSAVCHGVAGLLNIKLSDGSYLVKGKKVTGFANIEETFGKTKKIVPYFLQDELKKRGARYRKSLVPFVSKTCKDGRLLTGQNPFSTKALAKLTIRELNKINKVKKQSKVKRMDFFNEVNYQSLIDRLQELNSSDQANWGKMTVGQMLHHLNLSIGSGIGVYQLADKSNFLSRTSNKFLILSLMKRFPKNTKTPSTLRVSDSCDFESEKQQLLGILKSAYETKSDADWSPHTYFGKMSRKQWGKLIIIHCNHHFHQFGV